MGKMEWRDDKYVIWASQKAFFLSKEVSRDCISVDSPRQ